jgi:hypothetical protein
MARPRSASGARCAATVQQKALALMTSYRQVIVDPLNIHNI